MNNTPHTNCLTLRLLHAAKGYKAVAFDIFDTLLKRDCAHPADLCALMEVTHQAALGFAGARVAAEAETRQTLGREVTLAEIYAHPALRGTDRILPGQRWRVSAAFCCRSQPRCHTPKPRRMP